ncbi:MAG: alpha/beta hydrolase-fold protein [Bacteroidota bacterium]
MVIVRTTLLFIFLSSVYAQESIVTLKVIPQVHARESGTAIYIAGNRPEIGNWSPNAVSLHRLNDSVWSFSGSFTNGTVLQFKITNGSWDREAMYDSTSVPRNTVIEVTKDTTVILRPSLWKTQLKKLKPVSAVMGKVVFHRQMTAEGLNHRRDVVVWLPPSYETDTSKRYPVLYMHDGQNIFDPSTAFMGYDWRVDEVADSLIAQKAIEEVIIVGIYNTPDRLPEYSDSPLGFAYMNFVVNILKPMIDSAYRTMSDRRHTAVMGSSMGALSSLLFVWKRPDVFGAAACLSTSLWYDDERTLKEIRDYSGHKKDVRIYLDCGDREKDLLSGYRRMVDILKKKGYTKGKDLEYHLESKGVHSEHSWAHRVWRPLVFLYGKK